MDKSVTDTKGGKEEEASEIPLGKKPWPFRSYAAVDENPFNFAKTVSAWKYLRGGKFYVDSRRWALAHRSKRKESSSSSFLAETPHESDDDHGDHQKEIARLTKLLEVKVSVWEEALTLQDLNESGGKGKGRSVKNNPLSQPRIEKDEDSDTNLSIDTRVSCSSEEKEGGGGINLVRL